MTSRTVSNKKITSTMAHMRPLSSIALRFDRHEDRILVTIDAGSPSASAYWLTRRLALNVIHETNPYLARTSPVANKTPAELRGELAKMEREVALASTQRNVSSTPTAALESASATAELAVELNVSAERQGLRLRFRGSKGGEATVGCTRAELQRIVHMLEQEAAKAGWREQEPISSPPVDAKEAKRRAN